MIDSEEVRELPVGKEDFKTVNKRWDKAYLVLMYFIDAVREGDLEMRPFFHGSKPFQGEPKPDMLARDLNMLTHGLKESPGMSERECLEMTGKGEFCTYYGVRENPEPLRRDLRLLKVLEKYCPGLFHGRPEVSFIE
jgi:hypothetical protein